MSSKHVNFNDGGNSTKEIEKVSAEEKGDLWYSKENRQEMEAEVMMEQANVLVTKTVMDMEEHKGKAEDSEEVQAAVKEVLDKGVDGIFDFLAQHGQGLPSYTRAPRDEGSPTAANGQNSAADDEARQQVRQLVKHQVVVLMQSGVASFVSIDDVEKKTDEIMKLPRTEILRFLEQKPQLPASKVPVKPPAPYNWMNDGKHTWEELPAPVQEAAKVLGYDEESWVTKVQPEKSDKVWEDLSNEQQEAAIRIGFNPYSWDGVDPTEREESERYLDDSDSSSSDESETEKETEDADPEDAVKNTVREMVKEKLLGAAAFNEDNVDATVDTVMELPKPQIVAFLEHPLPEHWTNPPQEDETEVDESEAFGRESATFTGFVLSKDEDDDKPMDDDSSSDEEEEPNMKQPLSYKSDDEETDEFLTNFFSEEDKENIQKTLKDVESSNNDERTPLIPGKSRGADDGDPKKGLSTLQMGLIGMGVAAIGWFAYKKFR